MIGETVVVNGEPVANVLIEPGERSELDGVATPAGAAIAYTLRFPCDFEGSISDATIEVRGIKCKSVGFSDHYNCRGVFGLAWALPWDMTVLVERIEGDMRAHIALIATSSRYEMGNLITEETVIYEGCAQAKMSEGSEVIAPDGSTDAKEAWYFIVPWSEEIAMLRPGSCFIHMNNVAYDVTGIKDIDGHQDYISIGAMRHG